MSGAPSVTTGNHRPGVRPELPDGVGGPVARHRHDLDAEQDEVRVELGQLRQAGPGVRERVQHEEDDLAPPVLPQRARRRGPHGERGVGGHDARRLGLHLGAESRGPRWRRRARARSSPGPSAGPPSAGRRSPACRRRGYPRRSTSRDRRRCDAACARRAGRRAGEGAGGRRARLPLPVGPWQTAQCSA